jgi:hypothetical protein
MKSSIVDLAVSGSGVCLASSMIYVFGPGADSAEGVLLVLAVGAGTAFSCFGVSALRHLPSDPSQVLGDDSLQNLWAAVRALYKRVHILPWISAKTNPPGAGDSSDDTRQAV